MNIIRKLLVATVLILSLFIDAPPARAQQCYDQYQNPIPCPKPNKLTAACLATPRAGPAPLTVKFQASPDGGSGVFSYYWTFGEPGAPDSSEQSPTYIYKTPGLYLAAVHVNSPPGSDKFVNCQVVIDVSEPPTPTPTPTATAFPEDVVPYLCGYNTVTRTVTKSDGTVETYTEKEPIWCAATVTPAPGPTLECSGAPTTGASPLTVKFQSSPGGGTGMYDFYWTFGEPGAAGSSEQSPTFTYLNPGTYSAAVRMMSPPGQDPLNPQPGTFADCRIIVVVSDSPPAASSSPGQTGPFGLPLTGILTGGLLLLIGGLGLGSGYAILKARSHAPGNEELGTSDSNGISGEGKSDINHLSREFSTSYDDGSGQEKGAPQSAVSSEDPELTRITKRQDFERARGSTRVDREDLLRGDEQGEVKSHDMTSNTGGSEITGVSYDEHGNINGFDLNADEHESNGGDDTENED